METKSTCPYCGVGCGVLIEHDGARITGVRGDPAHPANYGRLCTKGATLHLSARPETRLLYPELRTAIGDVPVFGMRLAGDAVVALDDPARRLPLAALRGRRVHAVAGIGRPQRFFEQLAAAGLEVVAHAFPDHHRFVAADLAFGDASPILMTAKDAVKCRAFAPADCWEYPVRAQIGSGAAERILEKLEDGRTTA